MVATHEARRAYLGASESRIKGGIKSAMTRQLRQRLRESLIKQLVRCSIPPTFEAMKDAAEEHPEIYRELLDNPQYLMGVC